MTASAHQNHARKRSPETATHLFRIGQMVQMKSRFGVSPTTVELYRVTGTLPPRDNSPQYRIRSDDERHERVATQDALEAAGLPPSGNGTTLIERTFGNGQGTETQQPRAAKTEAGEGPAKA
ncbi:hypothetical protein ACFP9U_03625 [Nitratireductor sp. GCM10026969]